MKVRYILWWLSLIHILAKDAWGPRLVYPFLTYCNVTWSSTYWSNLNCIYPLQKHLEWLITKTRYLANTASLLSQLKVLDIFSINSFSVTTFLYSYHHNLLPSSFSDLFLNNQVHQYETSQASQYSIDLISVELILAIQYPLLRT